MVVNPVRSPSPESSTHSIRCGSSPGTSRAAAENDLAAVLAARGHQPAFSQIGSKPGMVEKAASSHLCLTVLLERYAPCRSARCRPRYAPGPGRYPADLARPASSRICFHISTTWPTPDAPTGWPLAFNPPDVLIGMRPSRAVMPSCAAVQPAARRQKSPGLRWRSPRRS